MIKKIRTTGTKTSVVVPANNHPQSTLFKGIDYGNYGIRERYRFLTINPLLKEQINHLLKECGFDLKELKPHF